MPVGGIKEKVLAAHRAGIRQIILPKTNEKDVKYVPGEVLDELTFAIAKPNTFRWFHLTSSLQLSERKWISVERGHSTEGGERRRFIGRCLAS